MRAERSSRVQPDPVPLKRAVTVQPGTHPTRTPPRVRYRGSGPLSRARSQHGATGTASRRRHLHVGQILEHHHRPAAGDMHTATRARLPVPVDVAPAATRPVDADLPPTLRTRPRG